MSEKKVVKATASVLDLGDDQLQAMPVKIGGRWYAVVEAHGDAAVAYRRTMMQGAEFDNDNDGLKVRKVPVGAAELEPVLVASCTYYAEFNEKTNELILGDRVPEETVRGWPSKHLKRLYAWIKSVSDLDEKENPTKQPIDVQKS